MKIKESILVSNLQTTPETLDMYLCRAEFAHIDFCYINNKKYFQNVNKLDMFKLSQLINRKKCWKREQRIKQCTQKKK